MRPILDDAFPDFRHAAALIGYGSDVLGFDDEMSRDHEWGPRVLLFAEDARHAAAIEARLARDLPTTFAGFSTHFGPSAEQGTAVIAEIETGPVSHRAQVLELGAFLRRRIGRDPRDGFRVEDWLRTPTQRLLELTAGEVFADATGDLTRVRELLGWYPLDVWLYAMAGHWQRIAEYEHFVGRTGFRGDELGSDLIAASLVRDVMRLGFLQQRRYAPYAKWLGTAYARLDLPERAALERAVAAPSWREREDALVTAYEHVARRHNELGVTETVDPDVRQFWQRPFRVLFADRFTSALCNAIDDAELRALAHPVGTIDALSDNTAFLERPELWQQVRLYDRT